MGNNRKIKAKATALTLTSIMMLGMLAGCGGNNGNNAAGDAAGNATNKGNAANSANAVEDTSPLTMTFFSADPNPNWTGMQDEVGKVITEKTGVTLNAEYAVGDPAQKVALIAASGDYPDLISAKTDVSKLVDAGAMLDLTDLIEKYAPNIKKY